MQHRITRRSIMTAGIGVGLGAWMPPDSCLKGTGCLPDIPDERDAMYSATQLVRSGPVPSHWDLSGYVREVYNQLETRSCCGWAVTRACHIEAQSRGLDVEHGSAAAAYAMGRAWDLANKNDNLEDGGSRPRSLVQAVRKLGIVPATAWPFDPAKVNEPVGKHWGAISRSVSHRPDRFYWIDRDGKDRIQLVQRALSSNHPVCVAVDVDASFEAPGRDYMIHAPSGSDRGGHYVCLVGYESGAFKFVNSWGSTYGNRGFAWMSWERLIHPTTKSLLCVGVEPL